MDGCVPVVETGRGEADGSVDGVHRPALGDGERMLVGTSLVTALGTTYG